MSRLTELKVSYNVFRGTAFVIGAGLIAIGVVFNSSACLWIGIWFTAAVMSTFVTTRMHGYLRRIVVSSSARRWMAWISFFLFAAQQAGLDLMMNQATIWNWAVLAFDVLVAVGFITVMKLVLLPSDRKRLRSIHRLGTMLVFLTYVLLVTGKAATLLHFNVLDMKTYPYSNLNMMTVLVATVCPVGIMVRLLLIPLEPKLNDFEYFILYYESFLFVIDACDGLSLYGELYYHITSAESRAGLGVVAGFSCFVASFLYFIPVVLSNKLQTALLQPKQNWLARLHRHGAPAGVDAPMMTIRFILWIIYDVPVSALFMKNFCGLFILRSFSDYLQFVNPLALSDGHLLDEDAHEAANASDGPRCRDPPGFYGAKAKELQMRVALRERQLKEHRKALLRYKQELDRLVGEVEKRDRLLAIKKEMNNIGAEIDDCRWNMAGGNRSDPPALAARASGPSPTLGAARADGLQPPPLSGDLGHAGHAAHSDPQPLSHQPAAQRSGSPVLSMSQNANSAVTTQPFSAGPPSSSAPAPPSLAPPAAAAAAPAAAAESLAHCSICGKDVPRGTFLQHFRECSRTHREAASSQP